MKNNKIACRRVGDFNIPNLILPPEEANIRLGKWGKLHKDYLEKHNRVFFNLLFTQGNFISTVPRLKIKQMRSLILLSSKCKLLKV